MKNYLCVNGKKTELTKEQLKQLGIVVESNASLSEDGKIAKIGEYEFIVLKNNGDTVELLLKDSLCVMSFDSECNNFAKSEIRDCLNDFAEKIADIVGEDNLVEHTIDLTSDDGLKCYGSIQSKMSLLTANQYREHVYTIDEFKLDRWWWLATAYSTPKHDGDRWIKCVSPSGRIFHDYCNYYCGVRPFCILKSNIFKSCEND